MERIPYPSNLTDEQWKLIEPLIPRARPGGRPRSVEMRQVINGILYINRGGCSWRMLPRDFPPWGTVHYYYRQFRLAGVWQTIHDSLRPLVRRQAGKKPTPTAAIIDSQSIKTAEKGGIAGMTQARKSRAESGTFSSTRWE